VRVPVDQFAEGLNAGHHAGNKVVAAQRGAIDFSRSDFITTSFCLRSLVAA
jgi:hypothetical protein